MAKTIRHDATYETRTKTIEVEEEVEVYPKHYTLELSQEEADQIASILGRSSLSGDYDLAKIFNSLVDAGACYFAYDMVNLVGDRAQSYFLKKR